ncbi:glycoprotein-N-acetylgalactosamine 3-beta-galactosyltransferase 1 isoform X2 [Zeugodacus cucurbitae]|uniref:glycoprotein-N-acetylgalactosamine 3-beta-galactosyltransferase 1 isoform X2 n=1 Tax=Zeugodacus cucurbitae TaxID=28588 RepID=UPI0023D948BE|nr:glycoprotein-N-acetylgalactosamine 3-beta-galactosyltransferase 1 isoform X2 [Zeugodacus cucurbitae]
MSLPRDILQKYSKFIYLPLICLIALTTIYFVQSEQKRLCNEILKLRSAKEIFNEKPLIFCLIVLVYPADPSIALKVKRTWSTHCSRVLFVSQHQHEVLEPLVILQPKTTREHKWQRLRLALRYLYENHFDEADWLLIADETNYVVLENLRKLLKPYSPDEPINFGCKMKDTDNQTYMRGGIVLSHEALRRLVVEGFTNASLCRANDTPYATEEMGKCLKNLGVVDGDSRDAMGRQRFIPFPPEDYLANLSPEVEEWFAKRSFYEINATTRQLSPEVISFSDVSPSTMVTLHYYIYKLRIFGRKVLPQAQNVTNHLENDTLLS